MNLARKFLSRINESTDIELSKLPQVNELDLSRTLPPELSNKNIIEKGYSSIINSLGWEIKKWKTRDFYTKLTIDGDNSWIDTTATYVKPYKEYTSDNQISIRARFKLVWKKGQCTGIDNTIIIASFSTIHANSTKSFKDISISDFKKAIGQSIADINKYG